MNCKNCGSNLRDEDGFCSVCGARVIDERISYKFIIREILDKVLNVDNKLLKTFWHLFTKPQEVIDSYIKGVRKRYFNPFNFLLISLTLAGITAIITKNVTLEAILAAQTNNPSQVANELTSTMIDFIFDYQSVFTILSVPIYAFVSWIVFYNRKKYNFLEHNVIYIFTSAQLSIVNFIPVGFLYITGFNFYLEVSITTGILFVVYNAYVLIRLFKLTFIQFIIKTLYFLLIAFTMNTIIGLLGLIGSAVYLGPEYIKKLRDENKKKDSIQKIQRLDSVKVKQKDSVKSISFYEASSKLNCLS